jgi:REP element-mobilizing transposase RayT
MPAHRPPIIAHHLIWTIYGHWLANDLRGSGSLELRDESFAPLGQIHFGRKPDIEQPTRKALREHHREAAKILKHSVFWIDVAKRQAVSDAFSQVIAEKGYTVWACAILSNHAHIVVRRHRDDAVTIWREFANGASAALRKFAEVGELHPVWASRPYKVFLRTPDEVRGRVAYVEANPEKEGLPRQHYEFVQMYDDWPFHKLH